MKLWVNQKVSFSQLNSINSRILCIIGLGNIGIDLEHSRHNVGFWFIDSLILKLNVSLKKQIFQQYLFAEYPLSQSNTQITNYSLVLLVKPLTYMNNSSKIIPSLFSKYGENIQFLIVADNMDLPPGQARLKKKGGTAGHKGLSSITSILNKNFFPLYIGIGHPRSTQSVSSFVLSSPPKEEMDAIQLGIQAWSENLLCLLSEDMELVIQRINSFKVNVTT